MVAVGRQRRPYVPLIEATTVPDIASLLEDAEGAERRGDLNRALERYRCVTDTQCSDAERAHAWCRLSAVYRNRCEWDQALEAARESGRIARRAGLNDAEAEALNAEAAVEQSRGAFDRAEPLLKNALGLTKDSRLRGLVLQNLGVISAHRGELGAAERHFSESYGCFMQAGYRRGEAFALNNLGRIALDRNNLALAEEVLGKAVEVGQALDDGEMTALATLNYAEALLKKGEPGRAEDLVSSALGYFATTGNRWRQVECLRLLGALHASAGATPTARRCYEDGLAIARQLGAQLEVSTLERALKELR